MAIPFDSAKEQRNPPALTTVMKDWFPLLETGGLQISLNGLRDGKDTIEIRDGQVIYVHLTPEQTADLLFWLDNRER